MVAHNTVDEHKTTTQNSSSPPPSPPKETSTLLSATLLPLRDTSRQPPSPTPPSSRQSTRSPGQQPSNRCLALPQPANRTTAVTTHYPHFRCQADYQRITHTASMLECSGFYWGPLGVEEAHRRLKDTPIGTFLIRDSRQKDVFFTLSYRSATGTNSVRILYKEELFRLEGSERTFPSIFALLEFYITSPKKSLSVPYRKSQPTLQELCRKRINGLCGGGLKGIESLPVNPVLRDFLLEFPYGI